MSQDKVYYEVHVAKAGKVALPFHCEHPLRQVQMFGYDCSGPGAANAKCKAREVGAGLAWLGKEVPFADMLRSGQILSLDF